MAEADPRGARPAIPRPRDKHIFVVEVWREGAVFRATARDVAQEQALRFDTPQRLADFLSTHWRDNGFDPVQETP